MQKITPFLWFDNQAEEAVNFYTATFKNSRIVSVTPYSDAGPGPAGQVMTINFMIDEQAFTALNGGPVFQFTEAISFMIHCDNQDEVDRLWEALTADGGEKGQCGWLKDRFGVSWQVVPDRLFELINDPDPARAQRVTEAMLKMTKLDIAALERAREQG